MPTEQLAFNLNQPERPKGVPIRYVLDGVFVNPAGLVLVREVPRTSEFSAGMIDLPSMEIHHVDTAHAMRHGVISLMRAHTGINPATCDQTPFMTDRAIAQNNGGYRDTRRIFYKGTIPTPENLPRGFHLVGQEDINSLTAAGLWRRESIKIAAEQAIRVAGQPVVPGTLVGYTHIDNSVNPQAATQAQRVKWNVLEQMEAAQKLADLTHDTLPQLR